MDSEFVDILKILIAERGKAALEDAKKCKALLADYTKNEYKKESRLLLQGLEAGVHKAIETADDLEICRKVQIRTLHEEYGLTVAVAVDIVNTLLLVLRGYVASPEADPEIQEQTQKNTVTKDSDGSSAYANRGRAYFRQNQYDAAIREFNEAIRLDPNNFIAYANRGVAHATLGQPDAAIKDFNEAIRLNSNVPSVYTNRGISYKNQGKLDIAIRDFSEALRLDPKNPDAYASRGDAYQSQKQYDSAIKDLNEAIKLDPKRSKTYYARGEIYQAQGQDDAAIKEFNEAMRLDPKNFSAYARRGVSYATLGQYDSAIKDLSEAIRLNPNYSFAFTCRGIIYRKQSQLDAAVRDFDEVIRLDPKDPKAYVSRGEVYQAQGQYDAAVKDFNEALRLDPRNSVASSNRSAAEFQMRKARSQEIQNNLQHSLIRVDEEIEKKGDELDYYVVGMKEKKGDKLDYYEEAYQIFKKEIKNLVKKRFPDTKYKEYKKEDWYCLDILIGNNCLLLSVNYDMRKIAVNPFDSESPVPAKTADKIREKMSNITGIHDTHWEEDGVIWYSESTKYPGLGVINDDDMYIYELYQIYSKNPQAAADIIVAIAEELENI